MLYDQKLLFTPGPLTTSASVKQAMMKDIGTRDTAFNDLVQSIRGKLLTLGQTDTHTHSVVLLQGSGTYGVESVLSSTIAPTDKVLILENGAYGKRMAEICEKAHIPFEKKSFSMIRSLPLDEIEEDIRKHDITHVAFVHCETTAGVMNDLEGIMSIINKHKKISIVDAMSSFGGVPIPIKALDIDYLITSSNKCLHGVPGIAIIFAKKETIDSCKDICRSLSLDLYEQYRYMEEQNGAFRFTSPTQVLAALETAIDELIHTGGIEKRHQAYADLQKSIQKEMEALGFQTLVALKEQSAIITTYVIPDHFDFHDFYEYMKAHGFLLYSGKLPSYDAFRIGNIGEITQEDVNAMLACAASYVKEWSACK